MPDPAPAKKPSESQTEMVQVVLPNDANPLGFILGGTVMHLIDIAGAIACHRHTRSLLVTAAVDGLQFLHPIRVGDLIILKARVTAVWTTSLEVEVEVFSEETLTGRQRMTSLAYLTFVAIDRDSRRVAVPGLILETADDKRRAGMEDRRFEIACPSEDESIAHRLAGAGAEQAKSYIGSFLLRGDPAQSRAMVETRRSAANSRIRAMIVSYSLGGMKP